MSERILHARTHKIINWLIELHETSRRDVCTIVLYKNTVLNDDNLSVPVSLKLKYPFAVSLFMDGPCSRTMAVH